MIHCVSFAEVHQHLTSIGYREVGRGELFRAYEAASGPPVIIRPPNVSGYLPESLVNLAFDASGLEPPAWSVFWGD